MASKEPISLVNAQLRMLPEWSDEVYWRNDLASPCLKLQVFVMATGHLIDRVVVESKAGSPL